MCSFFVLLALLAQPETAVPPPPNVLLIHADQHRFDCLGAMGNPDVQTPNLDALARDGVLFRNSFCTWPVCTPSRYSLLSGLYVQQHGGRTNRATLPPNIITFPAMLRGQGYATAATGKMHFMPAYLDLGFDAMKLAEQNGRGRLVDDYHRYLKAHNLIDSVDMIDQEQPYRSQAPGSYLPTFGAGPSNLPEAHHSTTWIGDRALEFVSGWKPDRPSLLMVGFIKPHHPFDPPGRWATMYDPDRLTIPPGWTDEVPTVDREHSRGYFDNTTLTQPALRRVLAHYYGTISQLDAQVRRLIDELKRKGLYDRTLILYTGDHGEYLGFHHMILKGNHMYDPLIKVPLIIKFPSQRHAGTVSDALVSSVDVTATILQECGLRPAPEMHGHPLQPVLSGLRPARKRVFAEDGLQTMVRTQTHKLLYTARRGESMFFDLASDPHELHNLYGDPARQDEIRPLKDALLDWYQTETRTGPYLDLDARQIHQPNVPEDRAKAEQDMERYLDRRMREILPQK